MVNTHFDAVVTAGGTKEMIDDVRYITNFSTGELGWGLAAEYAARGKRVLLLAPDEVIARFGAIDGVEHRPFTSANSLYGELMAVSSADVVLHGAAVSDYTPEKAQGKISSDKDELVIRLTRAPKILPSLRDHFGEDTTIVGFKLLSGVDITELIHVAKTQIQTAHTNLCIANDLRDHGANRAVHLVQPDGVYQTISGTTHEVARQLTKLVPSR